MINADAQKLFHAIGEKNRLEIIKLCFEGKKTVDELLNKTKLEKSLLSKHLKVLRDSEILNVERLGRKASYVLNPKVYKKLGEKTLTLPCCNIKLK